MRSRMQSQSKVTRLIERLKLFSMVKSHTKVFYMASIFFSAMVLSHSRLTFALTPPPEPNLSTPEKSPASESALPIKDSSGIETKSNFNYLFEESFTITEPDTKEDSQQITLEEASQSIEVEQSAPRPNAFSAHIGVSRSSDESLIIPSLGFNYRFASYRSSDIYEFNTDLFLHGDSNGRISLARFWFLSNETHHPYWKLGLGIRLKAKEGIATLIQYRNLLLVSHIGYEFKLINPLSLRLEGLFRLGLTGYFEAGALVGGSWSW